jgi:NAD(P)H dehydrogenase (quinone)
VLTTEGHAGAVYELGGDEAFTLAELATVISAAAGKQITYTDLPAPKLAQVLTDAGLPAEVADSVADADLGLSRGELFTSSGDLRRLIGRPTTPLADAVADALHY